MVSTWTSPFAARGNKDPQGFLPAVDVELSMSRVSWSFLSTRVSLSSPAFSGLLEACEKDIPLHSG